jgi:hypothetical protein
MTTLIRSLNRAKLSEPVRLYCYGVGSVLITGLVLAGAITGEWQEFLLTALGVLLGLPAAEAARATAYSPRSVIREGFALERQLRAGRLADLP